MNDSTTARRRRTWAVPGIPLRAAFVAAACSLIVVFVASGAPIALFHVYQVDNALTNAELGFVSVAYLVAAVASLTLFGRLSNHLGRRPVAIAALASAALSYAALTGLHGILALLITRVLQGLACGIALSGLGSYVVDLAPKRPRWLAAAITGSAPMVGISTGALACGALVHFGGAPQTLVYMLIASMLGISIVLTSMSPETMPRRSGALASLRPRLQIPAGRNRIFLAAAAAFVATWSFGGFYQAFGPTVTALYLGTASPLAAAAVFASPILLAPIGGPLSGRLSPATSLRAGMILFMLALIGIVLSLQAGRIVPFIAGGLIAGLAQGAASTGAIRALLADAQPAERAGVLSIVYLISYGSAAIPTMIAGALARTLDLIHIAIGYAAIGIAASVIAALTAGDPGDFAAAPGDAGEDARPDI